MKSIHTQRFKYPYWSFAAALLALTIFSSGLAGAQPQPGIKLVLQITIDGLRGDLINRYGAGFGTDGFRYLMKNGTYFTNAHYQYANTETIVGHAWIPMALRHPRADHFFRPGHKPPKGTPPRTSGGCRTNDCSNSGDVTARFGTRDAVGRSAQVKNPGPGNQALGRPYGELKYRSQKSKNLSSVS